MLTVTQLAIAPLLERTDSMMQEQILRDQLNALEHTMVNKQRWVEIMQAAGLSDTDMQNWHKQFEKMEPEAHQEFLESLGIEAEEAGAIRAWSRE